MNETALSEYARGLFNIGPIGEVPPVCLWIAADIQAAETAIKTAPSPGAAREAQDTLASINRRIHDMMTPPARCPRSRKPIMTSPPVPFDLSPVPLADHVDRERYSTDAHLRVALQRIRAVTGQTYTDKERVYTALSLIDQIAQRALVPE